MAHKLSLNISDGVTDDKFILVNDLSVYDQVIGINNRVLQVLPPFSDAYVILPFPESSHIAFSSIDLQYNERENVTLPDGLYKFHFSVAPNSQVYSRVFYYRTAVLMNKVYGKMLAACTERDTYVDECGNISLTKYQNSLLHIWMTLKGIQAMNTEFAADQADILYKQVSRLFDRVSDRYFKNC